MTDVQLYLAVGIPTLAVLIGFLSNVVQLNAMSARIGGLESRMDARFNGLDVKFDTLTGKVIEVDNRVTRIEAKLGIA